MKYFFWFLLGIAFVSCKDDDAVNGNVSSKPNILLIIADDMGKDATSSFSEGSIKPSTPHINKIKSDGLSFNNYWVYPTCSPTRASMITGKYGYRTGVKIAGDGIDASETILQKYITQETNNAYSTALVGKWHISKGTANVNPETFGLDYYAGLISGAVMDYYSWDFSEDGSTRTETGYTTEVFTDLAINWVNSQTKPWFLWLAYNAPHTPFHAPPAGTHSQEDLPEYDGGDPMPYYMAAIESMDYQIGRLLDNIPADELENTIIVFMGDNGSPGQVAQRPYTRTSSKGSLFQGGINVPLYVAGAGVSRTGSDDNLITSTDMFSTLAQVAGVDITEINDSKSFNHLLTSEGNHRDYQYSENDNGTNEQWTISNGNYKLWLNDASEEHMYNLVDDPYERNDILTSTLSVEEQTAKDALENELLNIRN